MTFSKRKSTKPTSSSRQRGPLWYERAMAAIALVNLGMVLFDLSYVPLRDFWLQGGVQLTINLGTLEKQVPPQPLRIFPMDITPYYDWVKAIEPHRDTSEYLATVAQLEALIPDTPPGDRAPLTLEEYRQINGLLMALRNQSLAMVNQNPFEISGKIGNLEKIKNRLRQRVFNTEDSSAKLAFQRFWSRDYLDHQGYGPELAFFNQELRPILETNYFRPLGENGRPIDNFALLDFPFFLLFASEFFLRTWGISRRYMGVSWFDAMLWRWYDVFLLIPVARWLRLIPVVIRCHQAQLINLNAVQKQVTQGVVAGIAEEITEIVVVRVINQVQRSLNTGEITQALLQASPQAYVDLNETNEVATIIRLGLELVVNDVLPQIQPELETLVGYSLGNVLDESNPYQTLAQVPGVALMTETLVQRISQQVSALLVTTLQAVIKEDSQFDQLLEKLLARFNETVKDQVQHQRSLERIESLLVDLLEEIKINYVERLAAEDMDTIWEQTRRLHQHQKTKL